MALLSALFSALLSACSTERLPLDPFGRPYDPANAMAPEVVRSCLRGSFDVPPELLSGTRPYYPVGELLLAKAGKAMVDYEVLTDGSARFLRGTAENAWFTTHAAIALRDWRFRPAQKDGVPVPTVCRTEFVFRIGNNPVPSSQPAAPGAGALKP
jgi:hypothetical protein